MLPTILRTFLLLIVCAFFSACQEIDVAQDISQRQANEIIAVLAEQGIAAHATRGTGSRGQYLIEVPANRYSEAVSILHYEGLPRVEEPSVSELLAPKGFLPNSRELESMRIDRALAAELENVLKANPVIVEVKASVRRPSSDMVGPQPPAHVSLIVRKKSDSVLNAETITSLVANIIPGVSAETIVLDIQDSLPISSGLRQGISRPDSSGKIISVPMKEFFGWWRVAENDYDRMVVVLLCAVLGFLIVGLFVGFSAGFLGRKVVTLRSTDNIATLKSDRATLSLNSPE